MPTPNVSVVSGMMNTGTENTSTFVRDVDPRLFYLDAQKYPLISSIFTQGTKMERTDSGKYALTGNATLKKRKTVNPKFEWTESENLKFAFYPTAAVAVGDTAITVSTSDDDYFVNGMEVLLTNAAGQREVARVGAVTAGSLAITRNVGSTGAIAMTTSDKFYLMGHVRAEDSTSATARQAKSETLYNYVEFISETYGNSLIEQATQNYHGDAYAQKKMEALSRLKRRLELMAWFGHRDVLNPTTNPIYHNGGIIWALENLYSDVPVVDVGGAMDKTTWETFLQDSLKNGNTNKVVFASSPVITAVSGYASNQLRPANTNLSSFGVAITEYQSPFGMVKLVWEPLFDEVSTMNGGAVCLDMDTVSWRYLEGNGVNLDLKFYEDRQANDATVKTGEILGVVGINVATGKRSSILKGVTG
jgi:hypothetical protein